MFEIRQDGMYIDNKPFKLYSGAMHYFRILPEYWEDRFEKMKAAGFNGVETVMCWNLHEPVEGEFDFSGMLDIVKFVKTAQKYGMYVIIRPGPYTCGEWDFGGFPAWLLKDKNLRIRCNNPTYLSKVEAYFKQVLSRLTPLQVDKGGNIIAMQIENEYGSYGNDKDYLMRLECILRDNGVSVPLFTSDGNCMDMLSGGTLPHIYKTLNFGSYNSGSFSVLDKMNQDLPKTCMEFWVGWFDHWGEMHHKRNPNQVRGAVERLLDSGANLNIYMFHGGTNFNFWAGANYGMKYQPTVTSYDDAALLNEYGDYTPAYHKIRELLLTKQGLSTTTPLPPSPKLQNIGDVELSNRADMWENLYVLGKKHYNATPESMEYFGQNFGYILYSKKIKGTYSSHRMFVEGVHDIAYVRINGKTVKKYDRCKNPNKKHNDGFWVKVPAFDGELLVEILVEGMGRTNYGHEMECDRKGISKVRLDYQTIFGWDIYTLPMDNLDMTDYSKEVKVGMPAILKGKFVADSDKDCFVDMQGFSKGFVCINGYNIGRYWEKGPQRSLYIPAPLLKKENEIVVFEQERYKNAKVRITDKHYL